MSEEVEQDDDWHVYLLRCADDTLYCGIARNVARRVAEHDSGKGAKYTRGRGPVKLLGSVSFPDKGSALRVEMAVKKKRKIEKLDFMRTFSDS